jgi:hypothetical protein
MKSVNQIEQEKQDWKSFMKLRDWTIWLTITFRPVFEHLKEQEAMKLFKKFFKNLNHPGKVFFDRYMEALVFFEKNRFKGFHIHAVLSRIGTQHCSEIEKRCIKQFGQSKAKPMHEGVPEYIAKKNVESKIAFFDFIKINSRYRETKGDKNI